MKLSILSLAVLCIANTLTFAEAPLQPPANIKPAPSILNRPISDFNLDKTSLSDALDYLRDTASVNMHVNWNALQIAGITKDTPVSLQVKNITLRKALTLLLADTSPATWYIDQGVIEVTTQEIADKHTYTRVYPVEDLVMVIPDFIGPQFNIQQASQSGQGGGGGQSPFQQTNTTAIDPQQARQNKQQRGNDLVTLITSTIRPDIWKSNGGTATIVYSGGMLIVNAPRQVHELISTR
ncbi:MAG TPA: hypothetical protein VFE58_15900 [Tepidisphaeraceae bacterium]|jgi:hypothetical protein|nr:hypothetical protein [Tepidisphaeraceae bacterium]